MNEPKKIKVIARPDVPSEVLEEFKTVLWSHFDGVSKEGIAVQDMTPVDEDFFLRRILRRSKDFRDALRIMIEIVQWRKSFKPTEMNPFETCAEAFQLGVMYFHGKSRGGAHILVITGSLIRKPRDSAEETACRQYFVYFVEYAAVKLRGNVTILLDCRKTKLDNLHMPYLRTMIDAFKTYYMDALDYVLVFELPVVLNACWKTLCKLIPSEGLDRTKMVNKKSILKYISQDNVPGCMGGSSLYAYTFDTESAAPPGILPDS